jgi:PIN domain nuclease of toxin-antitoxin system
LTQIDVVLERAVRLNVPVSLDSSALIAYLEDEEPIASLVSQLMEGAVTIVFSAITVSESLVRTAETQDRALVETILTSLQETPTMRIVPFGFAQLVEAAIVRAETRLKLPDAAIVATARLAGAIAIVGNDRAWQNKSLGIRYIHLDDVVREQQEKEAR